MSGVPGGLEILAVTPGFRGGSWVMLERALSGAAASPELGVPRVTAIGAGPRPPELPPEMRVARMPWPEYDRVAHRVEASLLGTILFSGPIAGYAVWKLVRRLRRGGRSSVLANGPLMGAAGVIASGVSGRAAPVFVWVHADIGAADRRSSRGFLRWLGRRAAGFFVNSEDVALDLKAAGVPEDRVRLVPNWVDAAPARAPDPRRAGVLERMARHRFVAIYVGRLVEYKHVRTYLAAAVRIGSPSTALVFVGDGELQAEVSAAAATNPNILAVGPMPNSDARALMAAANVTLSYADTTYVSASAMESLSEGTPVVYPAISCAPEKFERRVPIERELLPTPAGRKVAADAGSVVLELEARADLGSPTAEDRARCREFAARWFSRSNAAPLLRALHDGTLGPSAVGAVR